MKTKTLKVRIVNPAAKADKLGDEYASAKEVEKAAVAATKQVTSDIKAFAESKGVENGKEVIVSGKTWEVGYVDAEPSNVVDTEATKKALPARLFNQVAVLAVDEAKLGELVRQGKVTQAQLLACCVEKGGSRRVIVRRVKP